MVLLHILPRFRPQRSTCRSSFPLWFLTILLCTVVKLFPVLVCSVASFVHLATTFSLDALSRLLSNSYAQNYAVSGCLPHTTAFLPFPLSSHAVPTPILLKTTLLGTLPGPSPPASDFFLLHSLLASLHYDTATVATYLVIVLAQFGGVFRSHLLVSKERSLNLLQSILL